MGGLRTSSRLCALMAIAIVGVVAAHDQPTPTRSTGLAVEPLENQNREPKGRSGAKTAENLEQAQKTLSVEDQLKIAERRIKELSQRADAASQAARLEQDRARKAESARKITSREAEATLSDGKQERMRMHIQQREADHKLHTERELTKSLQGKLAALGDAKDELESVHEATKLQLQNYKGTHARLLEERDREVQYRLQLEKDVATLQEKLREHHDLTVAKYEEQAAAYTRNLEEYSASASTPCPPCPPCAPPGLGSAGGGISVGRGSWVVVRFPVLEGLLAAPIDHSWRYGWLREARVWWAGVEGGVPPMPPPGEVPPSPWRKLAEAPMEFYSGAREAAASWCPALAGTGACASVGMAWGHVESACTAFGRLLKRAGGKAGPGLEAALEASTSAIVRGMSAVPPLRPYASPLAARAAASLGMAVVGANMALVTWSVVAAVSRWVVPAPGAPSPRSPQNRGGGFPKDAPGGKGASEGGRGGAGGAGGGGAPSSGSVVGGGGDARSDASSTSQRPSQERRSAPYPASPARREEWRPVPLDVREPSHATPAPPGEVTPRTAAEWAALARQRAEEALGAAQKAATDRAAMEDALLSPGKAQKTPKDLSQSTRWKQEKLENSEEHRRREAKAKRDKALTYGKTLGLS